MNLILRLVFALFALSLSAHSKEIPSCPVGGSTLLDETFPAAAYVISLAPQPHIHYKDDQKIGATRALSVPVDFTHAVLEAYKGSKAPDILVSTNEIYFEEFKSALLEQNPKIDLSKIKRAAGIDYTWQQDYFESFFDPKSGRPVLKALSAYDRNRPGETVKRLVKALGKGTSQGQDLKTFYDAESPEQASPYYGEEGGNMEALPGGLCLTGNNLPAEFTKQFCGDLDNNVKVHVGWLEVGHVDELFKLVPAKFLNAPKQCQFALMAASPQKAFELLESDLYKRQKLLSSFDGYEDLSIEHNLHFYESKTQEEVGEALCEVTRPSFSFTGFYPIPDVFAVADMKADFDAFLFMFAPDLMSDTSEEEKNSLCVDRLRTITAKEFAIALKNDEDLLSFNNAIQQSVDNSKGVIKKAILERLPECAGTFKFIDVPNLFYGDKLDGDGESEWLIESGGFGQSYFPNPTNSVVANKTVLFSDPSIQAFRDHLLTELVKIGLKVRYIDTWEYSHIGKGNLHCATHAIRYCSPGR